ncbi:putative phage abortive infection protein [Bacillus subtilis]|uniref:putative phage abortive infection protein n=1 Tax=Bacillus subtilis TaxID=1423 RepID=UPI00295395AF|nr:putative phage abortive infection protein [Bacillus subtilis]WOO45603.1 putative phage abortive infection protein [Bacillus subtilis]
MSEKKDKWYGNENFWMWAGITACGLALIIPFAILFCTNNFSLKGIDGLGTFGDFFGGTTVGLFNLSSILLVLTAVIMQRKELEQTRNEFVQTNKTLIKQQFDNTFFNMINLQNEIVRGIGVERQKGKYALDYLNTEVKSKYQLNKEKIDNKKLRLIESYNEVYKKFIFGHYFRNMYRIMKFIDQAEKLNISEKKNYIGILRAQLSTGELLLIFYNALSDKGEKFRELIMKYNFFDDLLDDDPFYQEFKRYLES